jgi:hypothetical protein
MPVPVPPVNKPAAHPVFKPNTGNWVPSFNNPRAIHIHPSAPIQPREAWAMSRATWRTATDGPFDEDTHCVEQPQSGFYKGLAVADNATVIKGPPAEACIPPTYFQPLSGQPQTNFGVRLPNVHYGQPTAAYETMPQGHAGAIDIHPVDQRAKAAFLAALNDQRGGPITQQDTSSFDDFVDRAMAEEHLELPAEPVFPTIAERPRDSVRASVSEPTTAVGAPVEYSKLVGPLANWISNYVWKVCTTGLSLQEPFAEPS